VKVRRVCLPLACLALPALALSCGTGEDGGSRRAALTLRGAGATFPAPLYNKWIEEYRKDHPELDIEYDAVGSGQGIKRFLNGTVDFGASDLAPTDNEMARVERGVQLVPATAGIVVLAYSRDGLPDGLRLARDVYVDIFRGAITRWDDPRIAADNPGVQLPDAAIALVVRQDQSGTTFAVTSNFAAVSPAWQQGPGAGTAVAWPTRVMRASGNENAAGLIKRTPGALGYVEYGFAVRAGVGLAVLQNRAGRFVRPTEESGRAALENAPLAADLRTFVPDPEGAEAYPIATYTWLLLYRHYDDPRTAEALRGFVRWCLDEGQRYGESLGYVRLAPRVAAAGAAAVGRIK
jgi:phosphate transport system substrate-binding protein